MKIAVIGAGVSGLSIAQMLKDNHDIVIFEADSRAGGIIKCDSINGNLFHRTGGHVFNTKRQDVSDWFWKHFDKEKEFTKAQRNSAVSMDDETIIPYPIENHAYKLGENKLKAIINDWLTIAKRQDKEPANFEEFLRYRFGETLYELYFKPYNYKVWRRSLTQVPLSWLEGKLPMPTVQEMIYNNINHIKEQSFVHSSFYYPLKGGSQFLADRLAEGLSIRYNTPASHIERTGKQWRIDEEAFDKVIFCGNIKKLPSILKGQVNIHTYEKFIDGLESHGTTSVFCEISPNNYSWIYLPSNKHESHRIICSGNFSPNNNVQGVVTASIEFTDFISKEDILDNLRRIPYHPKYLTHHYEKYTYPIQSNTTREMINTLKKNLQKENFYLLGRFAEWEYYNMDVAIGAALDLKKIL
ncbi:protoporphyrinogen/coproporphyrinogen oxidase [Bacteroides cutis]|uniref:protoporphyrinogen/coproporphyrinogen oxidase n=1 Tax=Bacteroides cutis TaxID=2024197 RepID=UPI000C76B711|nr:NAD(P)-binding protein [Bacteroides cutis]